MSNKLCNAVLQEHENKNGWVLISKQFDSHNRHLIWKTWKMKIPGGHLYKTVDTFDLTDRDDNVAIIDKKVTVTFVPELKC